MRVLFPSFGLRAFLAEQRGLQQVQRRVPLPAYFGLDQIKFMEGLVQPDHLRTRILLWAEEEARLDKLPAKAGAVIEAVLYRGEFPPGIVSWMPWPP
jgi:hypothetical protein